MQGQTRQFHQKRGIVHKEVAWMDTQKILGTESIIVEVERKAKLSKRIPKGKGKLEMRLMVLKILTKCNTVLAKTADGGDGRS